MDDDRVVVTGEREIVLCGEASVTLTRAGKVLIRRRTFSAGHPVSIASKGIGPNQLAVQRRLLSKEI